MNAIFKTGLRAFRSFVDFVNQNPVSLSESIDDNINTIQDHVVRALQDPACAEAVEACMEASARDVYARIREDIRQQIIKEMAPLTDIVLEQLHRSRTQNKQV